MPMQRGHEVRPFAVRFWSKVDRREADECWPWTGSLNEHGYGSFRGRGKTTKAHRVAWSLTHPETELTPQNHVCHHCDNPPCCNPDHLYVGDYSTNTADKVNRGRQSRGPERGAALRGRVPAGDDHWTRRDPVRGAANAAAMIRKGPWNKGLRRG